MRRIAIINQKGGVGKTTTAVNLGAALARAGRRVVVVDLDPQANASLHLGAEPAPGEPSSYGVLCTDVPFREALHPTSTPGLSLVPAHIDLSGAELELASAIGRETILRDAIADWVAEAGGPPADYVLFDCPPSLGLLSVNGLAAAEEVIVVLQTEFFALQGLSKLIEIVQLLRRRLNPELRLNGVLPCLYDSRLRLAREVLAEIRRYFQGQVFSTPIRSNVKLAEAPSHGQTIFEYDPSSAGAQDHTRLAEELLSQEAGAPPEPRPEPGKQDVAALERKLADLSREHTRSAKPASPPAPEPEVGVAPDAPPAAGDPAPGPSPVEEEAPAPQAGPDDASPVEEVEARVATAAQPEPGLSDPELVDTEQAPSPEGAVEDDPKPPFAAGVEGAADTSRSSEPETASPGEAPAAVDCEAGPDPEAAAASSAPEQLPTVDPHPEPVPEVEAQPQDLEEVDIPRPAASEEAAEADSEPDPDPEPAPSSGALAPRGPAHYTGEDRAHLPSPKGPWCNR